MYLKKVFKAKTTKFMFAVEIFLFNIEIVTNL